MGEFFGTVIAALIGAMLAPYISIFLNAEKLKQENRLKYLEEAYLLGKRIYDFTQQLPLQMTIAVAYLQNKADINQIPKTQEEPFSKLSVILDYHLSAPAALISEIETFHKEATFAYRPLAESINITNAQEKIKLHSEAISSAITVATKGLGLSEKIITWVKNERNIIENTPNIFERSWKKCCDKFKTHPN